jgi:hypothetical protein
METSFEMRSKISLEAKAPNWGEHGSSQRGKKPVERMCMLGLYYELRAVNRGDGTRVDLCPTHGSMTKH